jgi:PAS domain S-box-containing protein
MSLFLAAKRYGLAVAVVTGASIVAWVLRGRVAIYPLAIVSPSMLLAVSARETIHLRPRPARVAAGAAAFVVALSVWVLVGWFVRSRVAIQLLPQLPPMMKITATCFLLCGLALFLQSVSLLQRLVLACAGLVAAISLLITAEYFFGVNIGIDEFLGSYHFDFPVSNPGRSAPASAICFVLTSFTLILVTVIPRNRTAWLLGLSGSIVAAVGLATSIEFAVGSSAAFGWGNFTGMAFHTAVGLCALGFGMVALGWQAKVAPYGTPAWLPISVMIGVATAVLGVWQGLIAGGQGPFAPIPAIVLIGGCGMATTFGLTVALAQRAHLRARQLRESERQLRLIVETLPVEVYCANSEGMLTFLNQRLARNAGMDQENLDAANKWDHVHPEDVPSVNRQWAESIRTGESFASLLRIRRDGAAYRWYQAFAEPLRDESGRVIQWYGCQIDVDDQKTLEEALRTMRTHLAHATQLATVAELSAAIAHEVNQPLSAVVANAYACQRWASAVPPNLERAQLAAERIVRDGNAASDVVNRVRALFKRSKLAAIQLDLNEVIAEVRRLLLDEVSGRSLRIAADLERDLPQTRADRVQIQQVIVNLARNGIEAMESMGDAPKVLSIRSRREGIDLVRVEVCDHGSGLNDAEKIFEPFFTTKATGMGMGLSICRSIIEAHQGKLWANNNESKGATFSFTLPVSRSEPL